MTVSNISSYLSYDLHSPQIGVAVQGEVLIGLQNAGLWCRFQVMIEPINSFLYRFQTQKTACLYHDALQRQMYFNLSIEIPMTNCFESLYLVNISNY